MNRNPETSHVIITGTTKGLGFSLCLHYLKMGYSVTGFARSAAPLELGEYIKMQKYKHVVADLKLIENANLVLSEFLSQKTKILVLNAADYSVSEKPNAQTILGQLNLNLISPVLLIEDILSQDLDYVPHIIFISSIMADIYDIITPAYGASKTAVSYFINSMISQGVRKVKFLNVMAGLLRTDISRDSFIKKMVSISYSDAADIIIHSADNRKDVIYIPHIWRYVTYLIALSGRRQMSKLLNKFR